MPLIIEPNNNSKDVAISQIVDGRGMYYTIRKRVFRFVDYAYLKAIDAADGKRITSLEWCANMKCAKLFDHRNDILEQVNVVNETSYNVNALLGINLSTLILQWNRLFLTISLTFIYNCKDIVGN